jgi:hypothetical protein
MDEVLSRAAHFPNALIRFSPSICEIFQHDGPQGAATFGQTYSTLPGVEQGVGDLAENVQLKLLVGRVSDAHRRGSFIASEPRNCQFRQPALAPNSVDDLHLSWTAGHGANEPVSPCPRLIVVSEVHQASSVKVASRSQQKR